MESTLLLCSSVGEDTISCFNVQLNCYWFGDPLPFFVSLLQFETLSILSTVSDFKILLFVHINYQLIEFMYCSKF